MSTSDLPAILGGEPAFAHPPGWPPVPWPSVGDAAQSAMQDGSWGRYHGPHCRALVEALAEYHSAENVQLCSSGTVAVELALRGAKVEPGDEVLLAAYDFKANFQNVLTIGAVPVLVDLDPQTWQLNPESLEAARSDKTKAIIASHLHGGLVNMTAVCDFGKTHGLVVIEDACQATGATVGSDDEARPAGMTGDVGVLSFGGSKLLTSGRGGAVLTNRADIAQRIRLYTQRGNEAYPLSELQAAVLLPQLRQLDEMNATRLERAVQLARLIVERGLPLKPLAPISPGEPSSSRSPLKKGSDPLEGVEKQGKTGGPERVRPLFQRTARPAFYKLGFQYTGEDLSRDRLCSALRVDGVALDAGFRALHQTHSKRRFRTVGELAQADAADERCVMLHHPVLLEDEATTERLVAAIERVFTHSDEVAAAPEPSC